MIEEKLVYSVAEVGQLLGVSRPKVYDLTNRSDFPVVQVGRRKLIPKKSSKNGLVGKRSTRGLNVGKALNKELAG